MRCVLQNVWNPYFIFHYYNYFQLFICYYLHHSPKNRCTLHIIMCKIMPSALQLNLFSFLSFTLFYPVFMVWWYGVRLSRVCGVLAWSYTALCPAFHWLLSKHTQRWKPFLLAHTVKEALFCWRAAETQRTKPSGWSLCLLCAQIWQWNIKHINWPWVDHLTWHENWNFLTARKAVCKLLETHSSKTGDWEYYDVVV